MILEHGFNYEATRLPDDSQVIAATNLDTVVGAYKPIKKKSDDYKFSESEWSSFFKNNIASK